MRQSFAKAFGEPEDEVDPDVLVPHWDAKGSARAGAAAAAAHSDVQRAGYDQAKASGPQ